MTRRLLFLAAACTLLTACANEPTPPPSIEPGAAPSAGPDTLSNAFDVRGVYLGVAFDSAAAVIDHEAVPGFMGAMRMQLRVADPSELRGLRVDDKIRFRLADPTGDGYEVSGIVKLPPDTPLKLADYGPAGVPLEDSVPDTTASAP